MNTDEIIHAIVHGDLDLTDADEMYQNDAWSMELRFDGDAEGEFVTLSMDLRTSWRSYGINDPASEFDILEVETNE